MQEQLNSLMRLLNETKKYYGPHYPSKTWDNSDNLDKLTSSLSNIVDYLGYSEANIAIKKDIARIVSTFLVLSIHADVNIEASIENLNNTTSLVFYFSFFAGDTISINKLQFIYDNDTIKLITPDTTHYKLVCQHGKTYSNSIILYDTNKNNQIYVSSIVDNSGTSINETCEFNDNGIEIHKDFVIIPKRIGNKAFENDGSKKIVGRVERNPSNFNLTECDFEFIGNFSNLERTSSKKLDSLENKKLENIIISSNIFTSPSGYGRVDFYGTDINKIMIPCNHLINRIDEELSMFDEEDEYYDRVLLQKHMEELEQYQKSIVTIDSFFPFTPIIHTPYSAQITEGVKNYGSNIKKELI